MKKEKIIMLKKSIVFLILAVLLLGLFTGCSKPTAVPTEVVVAEEPTKAPEASVEAYCLIIKRH